jgi:hypothetical protein
MMTHKEPQIFVWLELIIKKEYHVHVHNIIIFQTLLLYDVVFCGEITVN